MCGFAGILTARPDRRAGVEGAVRAMAATLVHRGPDGDGFWSDAQAGVALGFRRLAILDLSPLGDQPMRSASGRYVISFNGEIYNFRALRDELRSLGHSFRGGSDTEVMLAAFEAWGVAAALPRLLGMFALAVWDASERTLTLARDRLGKKPLFVWSGAGQLFFASELKALVAHPDFERVVDPGAVASYLRYLYVPAPASVFRGVSKLPPAHYVVVRDAAALLPEPVRYWDARAAASEGSRARITKPADALDQLAPLLDDAVRLRLESDVPLGALLSGGIDSSLVVARMRRLAGGAVRTYTIGFDEPEWDESGHAANVAKHLGTSHTTLRVSGRDALDVVPELPTIFDEPLADPSQIPTVLVCRLSRRDVTVALCGDGGDEVFGGYNRYLAGPRAIGRALALPAGFRALAARGMGALPVERWDALAGRVLPRGSRPRLFGEKAQKLALMLAADSPAAAYRSLVSAFQDPGSLVRGGVEPAGLEGVVLGAFPALSLAERMMLCDQLGYLPDDLLAKIDRASMSASLEVRAPLLDHRVVELAWRMAPELKLHGGETKWVLRELLARDVPRALFERPKMGFSVPVRAWLRGPLRPWAEDLLAPASLAAVPVLDAPAVRRAWQALLDDRAGPGLGVWAILQLVAWWRVWRPVAAG